MHLMHKTYRKKKITNILFQEKCCKHRRWRIYISTTILRLFNQVDIFPLVRCLCNWGRIPGDSPVTVGSPLLSLGSAGAAFPFGAATLGHSERGGGKKKPYILWLQSTSPTYGTPFLRTIIKKPGWCTQPEIKQSHFVNWQLSLTSSTSKAWPFVDDLSWAWTVRICRILTRNSSLSSLSWDVSVITVFRRGKTKENAGADNGAAPAKRRNNPVSRAVQRYFKILTDINLHAWRFQGQIGPRSGSLM